MVLGTVILLEEVCVRVCTCGTFVVHMFGKVSVNLPYLVQVHGVYVCVCACVCVHVCVCVCV